MAPPPPIVIDAQAVSGITGSISIACWIIVFAPQIYQNFIRKSAEGLSLLFVVLWLLGDLFNVLGAILQGVLPTMTILAIYYTLADLALLWQCIVYGHGNTKQHIDPIHLSPANPLSESEQPLLESVISREEVEEDLDEEEDEEEEEYSTGDINSFHDIDGVNVGNKSNERFSELFYNLLMVALVVIAGFGGWYLSNRNKPDDGGDLLPPTDDDLVFKPLAQSFGWFCAALYLGSRIPQILLNYERKSCEGISFMFFLFACLGNMTYVVSILSVNTGRKYLLVNSSWLAGSLGTLVEDFIIFIQFFVYKGDDSDDESYEDEEEEEQIGYGSTSANNNNNN